MKGKLGFWQVLKHIEDIQELIQILYRTRNIITDWRKSANLNQVPVAEFLAVLSDVTDGVDNILERFGYDVIKSEADNKEQG